MAPRSFYSVMFFAVAALIGVAVATSTSMDDVSTLPFTARSGVAPCPRCDSGTVCVGTARDKRCVIPMGIGKRCGQDPYWICAAGLRCSSGICRGKVVGKGQSCVPADTTCAAHLQCVGPATDRRCVSPMGSGQRCGQDPYWICKKGLRCSNGVCRSRFLSVGENCLVNGFECKGGLVCAGFQNYKKCVRPMRGNEPCGQDPFWICSNGLVCAGPAGSKKCVMPMEEGELCGKDPYWVCGKDLGCVFNVCRL